MNVTFSWRSKKGRIAFSGNLFQWKIRYNTFSSFPWSEKASNLKQDRLHDTSANLNCISIKLIELFSHFRKKFAERDKF